LKTKLVNGILYLEIPTVIKVPIYFEEIRNQITANLKITIREGQIIDGITKNLSNKEIANLLNISERTTKFHVSSVLSKFGISKRQELATVMAQRKV
jgi:DNA-binding NarL/FixJ family response regulator